MVILVTGGSRSGKSSFAMERAARGEAPHLFLATAQALDGEMERRIEAHRAARPAAWGLVEEPVAVPAALQAARRQARTVVVDCLTVWMANLLLADESFGEAEASRHALALLAAARDPAGTDPGRAGLVIVVTNEVGSGIVPDNALARRFRDCAGRANQVLAAGADEVNLLVSGLPFCLKQSKGTP